MPRRATLTYSSEDAPALGEQKLYVYYCRNSGNHALTTSCELARAPKRKTDGASVIDTEVHTAKLYTTDGGVKVIRRANGSLEKQHRQNVGICPVAYRSEPGGKYLYIMKDALTSYSAHERGEEDQPPVPPCILEIEPNTSQLALEVDDRADKATLLKVSSDYIRIQITNAISNADANEELLEFMREILGVRLGQLSLGRGESTRHKLLIVKDMTPIFVFAKLQEAMSGRAGAPVGKRSSSKRKAY